MSLRKLFLAAALPVGLVLIGCGPTGTSGGSKSTTTDAKGNEVKVDSSFSFDTIKVLPLTTTLKHGEAKTYDLSVKRGKDFKEDVEVTAEAPANSKLKVEVAPKKVESSSDGTFKITVTVEDGAPVGEHKVKLIGKPAKGETASADLTFKVEAKK